MLINNENSCCGLKFSYQSMWIKAFSGDLEELPGIVEWEEKVIEKWV